MLGWCYSPGMYFTSRGGFALHNPQEEASLKVPSFPSLDQSTFGIDCRSMRAYQVSAFVLTGDADGESEASAGSGCGVGASWTGDAVAVRDEARAGAFPFLRLSFDDTCSAFGPNDFFVLQKCMKVQGRARGC